MKYMLAVLALGLCLTVLGADKEKPLPKDIPSLKALAEKGDARAQNKLGWMYHGGQGVKRDINEASKYYYKAASQGFAEAQYNFSLVCSGGRVDQSSKREELLWLRKAAEQGHVGAQFDLGYKCQEGVKFYDYISRKSSRVGVNLVEAEKWYRKAAKQGHIEAQYRLARHFVKSGPEKVKWYLSAAKQGHQQAQKCLIGEYTSLLRPYSPNNQRDFPIDLISGFVWLKFKALNDLTFFDVADVLDDYPERFHLFQTIRTKEELDYLINNGKGMGFRDEELSSIRKNLASLKDPFLMVSVLFQKGANGRLVGQGVRLFHLLKTMTPDQIAKGQELSFQLLKKNPKILR